jgi:hypothetical protein
VLKKTEKTVRSGSKQAVSEETEERRQIDNTKKVKALTGGINRYVKLDAGLAGRTCSLFSHIKTCNRYTGHAKYIRFPFRYIDLITTER